jgi:hypothetical protein
MLPIITLDAPAAKRLRNIAGETDAAVSDAWNAGALQCFRDIGDRGNLRHADAGNDTRRADRTGADTDLDAVGTMVSSACAAAAVAILPPMTSTSG